jgi:hypothetical protein
MQRFDTGPMGPVFIGQAGSRHCRGAREMACSNVGAAQVRRVDVQRIH